MTPLSQLKSYARYELIDYLAEHGEVEQYVAGKWEISKSLHITGIYRVPRKIKPSINTECLNKKWKWMAIDKDESVYLFTGKPSYNEESHMWESWEWIRITPEAFNSFSRGNVDWRNSLVRVVRLGEHHD